MTEVGRTVRNHKQKIWLLARWPFLNRNQVIEESKNKRLCSECVGVSVCVERSCKDSSWTVVSIESIVLRHFHSFRQLMSSRSLKGECSSQHSVVHHSFLIRKQRRKKRFAQTKKVFIEIKQLRVESRDEQIRQEKRFAAWCVPASCSSLIQEPTWRFSQLLSRYRRRCWWRENIFYNAVFHGRFAFLIFITNSSFTNQPSVDVFVSFRLKFRINFSANRFDVEYLMSVECFIYSCSTFSSRQLISATIETSSQDDEIKIRARIKIIEKKCFACEERRADARVKYLRYTHQTWNMLYIVCFTCKIIFRLRHVPI